jgi:hypothetical protein
MYGLQINNENESAFYCGKLKLKILEGQMLFFFMLMLESFDELMSKTPCVV